MGFRTAALSSSDAKREFAMKLGANDYIDAGKEKVSEALQKIGGAALIVVTAPNPELIPDMFNGLAPCGKLLILAREWSILEENRVLGTQLTKGETAVGEVPVNTLAMVSKGLSVNGWPAGHAMDCEESIAFAKHHDVKCRVERFPLEQANEAMKHMESGKVRFRGVLVMG